MTLVIRATRALLGYEISWATLVFFACQPFTPLTTMVAKAIQPLRVTNNLRLAAQQVRENATLLLGSEDQSDYFAGHPLGSIWHVDLNRRGDLIVICCSAVDNVRSMQSEYHLAPEKLRLFGTGKRLNRWRRLHRIHELDAMLTACHGSVRSAAKSRT